MKESITRRSFTKGVPEEIFVMLQYARKLKFTEVPDYDYLRELLEKAMRHAQLKNDGMFDWVKAEEMEAAKKANKKISPDKPAKPKSPKKKSPKKLNTLDREILAAFKFCNEADTQSRMVPPKMTK